MIQNLNDLPGAKVFGRRKALSTDSVPESAASLSANLIAGRRGQVAVVDKIDMSGLAGNPQSDTGAPFTGIGEGFGFLRSLNANSGTPLEQLPFGLWRPAVTSTNAPIYSPVRLVMEKFGWVPATQVDSLGREFPSSVMYTRLDGSTSLSAFTFECAVQARFVDKLGAQAHDLKEGSWGGVTGAVAGTQILAAPGVGFYWRIHTLFIAGVGGVFAGAPAPLNETIALSDDGNTTQIMSWRVTSALERGRVEVALTDIDWPVRENSAISLFTSAGLGTAPAGGYCGMIGAERCPIVTNPFVNLTGAPA